MTPALLFLAAVPGAPVPTADITVPPGFVAHLYSGPDLANDIYTMTIDPAGRVLVAGRGYVKVLADDDGDGRADRAADLVDGLRDGPMGLLAEGDSLYVVADGGLKRYRGYNGRDKLTNPPETLLAIKTAGEHDAHAVRRGPDGWLYLLCGNMAGVRKEHADPKRSPVKDPVAGCLVRISPDGKTTEVVADGFRNAYGFDFNLDGEPFTYDSDNERDVGLPWYEPCRFYHVVPGGNYGWRSPQLSQTWRKPPYFADVVPPVCYLGRGSPTGVACYRNTHFPERYRGGFFLADWTFGRVYFVPLEAKASTYAGKPEVFAEAAGENGFAPTGLAVHPQTGELFVSIGGRGTRGGVYRIRAEQGGAAKELPVEKRSLDWDPDTGRDWRRKDALVGEPAARRRALELMWRHRERFLLQDLVTAARTNLAHEDPLVRAAAGRLALAAAAVDDLTDPQARLTVALADRGEPSGWTLGVGLEVLESRTASPELKLQAARVIQLALGDLTDPKVVGTVWEGYTFRRPVPPGIADRIIRAVEANRDAQDPDLQRELVRLVAGVGGTSRFEVIHWLKQRFTVDTDVRDDIHSLAACGRLRVTNPTEKFIRLPLVLLSLDEEADKQKLARDRHWPMRLEEIAAALGKDNPDMATEFLRHPKFGRPGHLLFVKPLKLDPAAAARKFVAVARNDPNYGWTPGLVAFLGALPDDEARPVLLQLWDRGGLEDAIVPLLARDPKAADRDRLLVGLRSLDPEVVRASAAALAKLPAPADNTQVIAAVNALRRLPDDKPAAAAREAVTALLRLRTGQPFGPDAKKWADWFAKEHPSLAAKVSGADGFDAAAWAKRTAAIDWAAGDPARGKAVFAKATCAACHDGGRAVGPSLLGVSKRFSRDDLLTAVVQPNKDVSPRYRPTRITTTEGKAHVGMIVYEATDGVILQTGPDTTVRVAGESIESRRLLDTSLMPAGLLDKLTDPEVADLLAYLRTLDDPKPK